MQAWARVHSLFRNLLRRRQVDLDLDDELNAYLDLLTEDKIRAGMSLGEARRTARIELGGVHQVKEEIRQARAGAAVDAVWRDLRSAARSLSRTPGFTLAAVVVIALGIGANSAVFSVVRGVLLRPLPFHDPGKIVQVRETLLSKGIDEMACAPADFEYWRNPDHVLTMSVTLPESKRKQAGALFPQILQRIEGLPGITAAGAVWPVPLSGSDLISTYKIEGRQPTGDDTIDSPLCNFYSATPGYFNALGIRLLAGRYFTDSDSAGSPRVVIVSDIFARRYFPGETAVGKRLLDRSPLEIVGVVEDVRQNSLDETPLPQVYQPFAQNTFGGMALVLRTAGAPANLVASTRSEVTAVVPDQPVADVNTMDEYVSQGLSQPRMATLGMGAFAFLSMILAAVGLYGVMAHSVSRRTREIGIRMAFGAKRREILRLTLVEGMIQIVIGLALGLGGALCLSRLMASLLYGVRATDAQVFISIPVIFAIVTLLASFAPACRAASVNPIEALRHQ